MLLPKLELRLPLSTVLSPLKFLDFVEEAE